MILPTVSSYSSVLMLSKCPFNIVLDIPDPVIPKCQQHASAFISRAAVLKCSITGTTYGSIVHLYSEVSVLHICICSRSTTPAVQTHPFVDIVLDHSYDLYMIELYLQNTSCLVSCSSTALSSLNSSLTELHTVQAAAKKPQALPVRHNLQFPWTSV